MELPHIPSKSGTLKGAPVLFRVRHGDFTFGALASFGSTMDINN